LITLVGSVFLAATTPVFAIDGKTAPTGTWKLTLVRPGRPTQQVVLKLEMSGDGLVGMAVDS
jgi:hypothetical protein